MTTQIGEILKVRSENNTSLKKHSISQQEKVIEIRSKFGETFIHFAKRFSPDIQIKLVELKADFKFCYNAKYPTLSQIGLAYSNIAAMNWLEIQFDNLNDFVGVRDKMSTKQIEEVAHLFFSDCSALNISEVALFFIKFKSGHFGEFYGSVDPLKIMTAKNKFLVERMEELNRVKRKQIEAELEEKRTLSDINCITYEEYKKQKKAKLRLKIKTLSNKVIKRKRLNRFKK